MFFSHDSEKGVVIWEFGTTSGNTMEDSGFKKLSGGGSKKSQMELQPRMYGPKMPKVNPYAGSRLCDIQYPVNLDPSQCSST